jgi:N-acetyl sugar amidotransferase
MRWCARCILPDTRPGLVLDADDVCSACRMHERRPAVDWDRRRAAFAALAADARSRSRGYDCLIPVSGGKDSTWQTILCLEHGLNPLAVTWKTPARTPVGARNLANLVSLGVDHIDYQVNPKVERAFMLASLRRAGTPALPMHMALFSIPLAIAARFQIPLVVWGENSAVEYAGEDKLESGFRMDSEWLRKHGVTGGTTARDWVSDSLTEKALTPYFAPTPEELEAAGIRAVFLGHYFPWDPETTLRVAREHGFEHDPGGPRTGYYNYADIDDDFISVHHYLKWFKFGFTRLFDNLSLEIRNGRMTRDEAVRIVAETGDTTPHGDIAKLCAYLGITVPAFYEIIEPFRNTDIWVQRDGVWTIPGFLIPGWEWT